MHARAQARHNTAAISNAVITRPAHAAHRGKRRRTAGPQIHPASAIGLYFGAAVLAVTAVLVATATP